ncbi:MFS transporter [Streptomyces sp. NBC_01795]|uniref:MFS transporter n=1 Tax=unclassified Streptomyces TaxID=2593676 RepID=UPI002DD8A6AF|nr:MULTISPECIES: MFS transporter [unclassified Streptomyces]WSA90606.1 MFS transporter [Streptomyces sp. NBC_01795]WSB74932.1 MFS transporter [Streptomyces sp. NBC_01775]WSS16787.1 MFS transporter [Streptomyces sp. NBC_01186]
MIVTAVVQMVVYGVRPLLSYEALALDAGPRDLGLLTASFSVLSLAAAVPMGRAVDRWGERQFLIAGPFVMAAVSLALLMPQRIASLVVVSAMLGLGHMGASVGIQTLIARTEDPAVRHSRFAAFTIVNSAGQLLAPAAAGLLASGVTGAHATAGSFAGGRAYIAASVVAVIGLMAALGLGLSRRGRSGPQRGGVRLPPGGFRTVMRVRSMPNALLASFTVLSAVDLLIVYLPAYGAARGLSVQTVGLLLAVQGVASLVARVGMLRLIRRLTRRRLLTLSMVAAAAGLAVLPLVDWLPGLYLLMVVIGFGLGLGQPITLSWVADHAPDGLKGTAMSVRLSGNRLGQTLVPMAVGAVAGSVGLAAAFLSPAVLLVTAGFLVFRSRLRD